MTFTLNKKPKIKKVGIRLTQETEKKALKFGRSQGVIKLGTICSELVEYAIKVITEKK